ncbi:hypothetical protein D3C73_764660 [compost metagenome]
MNFKAVVKLKNTILEQIKVYNVISYKVQPQYTTPNRYTLLRTIQHNGKFRKNNSIRKQPAPAIQKKLIKLIQSHQTKII